MLFGGSETGRPEGRPERPPRRSTTRSKSTRSSRLCSLSLSSVVSRSVPLRDVCVGKICLASRGRMSFVFGLQRSDYKILFRPLDVLPGPGHAVRRRSRRALTVETRDPSHQIVDASKNLRATAAAARTRISHNSNPTSGHLKWKF